MQNEKKQEIILIVIGTIGVFALFSSVYFGFKSFKKAKAVSKNLEKTTKENKANPPVQAKVIDKTETSSSAEGAKEYMKPEPKKNNKIYGIVKDRNLMKVNNVGDEGKCILQRGEKLLVLKQEETTGSCLVRTSDGITGYISSDLIKII